MHSCNFYEYKLLQCLDLSVLVSCLLAEADHCPWDYQSFLSHEGDEVKVTFHPVPTQEMQEEILSSAIHNSGPSNFNSNSKEQGERSKFGPQPKFDSPDFDFQVELKRLPFPINLGEIKMSKAQQVRFLELIYDNQSMFSLCDEDLSLCDHLKHTIPTTTDKPVYLLHCTIPV